LPGESRCRAADWDHGAVVDEVRSDTVVVARMHAAALTLRAAGLEVDAGQSAGDHLRRAVRWQHFSTGPVSELHRSLGRDIARGSLRLWAAAGGRPEALVPRSRRPDRATARTEIQLARVELSSRARRLCAALRDELSAEAAVLPRRAVSSFDARVRGEVLRVVAVLDEAVADRLTELGLPVQPPGWPEPPVAERLPARRRPGLENRLSTLVGAGFGVGVSVSVSRVVAELLPGSTPAIAAGCGLIGLCLTAWTVLARRLLAERAAAERWLLETAGNVRLALEERVLTRILAAEGCQRNPRRSGPSGGDTPNYPGKSRPR